MKKITQEQEKERLQELMTCLKYTFADTKLLLQAVTHSSYAHEYLEDSGFHNERLEFLGDAVLELAVSRMLYTLLDVPEGDLSKKRASIVCEPSLAYVAKKMELGQYLRLSHGEEKNGGRSRNSLLADLFEALIGAIYLDSDYARAEKFIERELFSRLEEIEDHTEKDYKTIVQELVQSMGLSAPTYELIKEDGPPHNRVFVMQAVLNGKSAGEGSGRSKKEAEQQAAKVTYEKLKGEETWN